MLNKLNTTVITKGTQTIEVCTAAAIQAAVEAESTVTWTRQRVFRLEADGKFLRVGKMANASGILETIFSAESVRKWAAGYTPRPQGESGGHRAYLQVTLDEEDAAELIAHIMAEYANAKVYDVTETHKNASKRS